MSVASRVGAVALLLASVLVLRATSPAAAVVTTITGTVFEDYNSNNTMNTTSSQGAAVDRGVAGVNVRAFGAGGAYLSSATTAANGTYSIDVSAANGAMVRIEFSLPTTDAYKDYRPGYVIGQNAAAGSSLNTTVQFAKAGDTGVNLALVKPGEYCANQPTLVTCTFDKGAGSSTNVGAFTVSSNPAGFVDVTPNSTRIGASATLGAVWGIGADRSRNTFYGTYVRRGSAYGSAGAVNAIYRINLDAPGTVSTFVTLPGSLPAHDATPAGTGFTAYSGDTGIFAKVGRVGLGDVDTTSDGSTLLAVDMDETAPKLWFVPINGTGNAITAGTPTSAAITKPSTFKTVTCPGNWHPMGLGVRGSRILVGGVCGAENTVSTSTPRGTNPTSATAFVLEYTGAPDGTGSFSTIWADTLSYQRSCVYSEGTRIPCVMNASTVGSVGSADWAAWNEYPNLLAIDGPTGNLWNSNTQPMLSNIEIADNGDLVLALRDRHMDQNPNGVAAWSQAYVDAVPDPPIAYPRYTGGIMSGGDIRRVCNSAGVLSTETGGSCPTMWGSGSRDASGTYEYYVDGYEKGTFNDANGNPLHAETATGAFASMPGYSGIWGTVFDVTSLGQQGVMSWAECPAAPYTSLCRGPSTGFGTQIAGSAFGDLNGFNKGGGLADIEVVCDAAPVQIGNRLWIDSNRDGIQDPNEAPVAGVMLRLYDMAGTLVSTAITDSKGQYLFSSMVGNNEAPDGGPTPDPWGGNLKPNTAYIIKLDRPSDFAAGGPLAGYWPTRTNGTPASSASVATIADNNAVLGATGTTYGVDRFPEMVVAPHAPGNNDHTFDAGFVTPAVSVGNRVWNDIDRDGLQDSGEPGISGVTVRITKANGDPVTDVFGNAVTTTTTDANGNYTFANLPPGSYKVTPTDPSGYVAAPANVGTDTTVDSSTGSATSANLTANGASDTSLDFGYMVPAVSVGNRVWNDVDRDGLQDAGEPGIPNVTLQITKANGDPVTDVFGNAVTTTTTDANGNYAFANLPVGQYKVTPVDPAGYLPTTAGVGTDRTLDSSTGATLTSTLTTNGASDTSIDFGYLAPAVSVGDRVWNDVNGDGVQTAGEPGLAGVVLTITRADGTAVTDVFGNAVTTTTTDVNGNYVFVNLPPGSYRVSAATPIGFDPTQSGQGTPTTDSSTGSAVSVTLSSTGAADTSLDFGFVARRVSVGNRVWNDLNRDGVQTSGEPGIPNVTLSITKPDGSAVTDVFGNAVTTTTTDANGNYVFANLPVGQYKVSVVDPAGFIPTASGLGTAGVDSSTGSVLSASLTTNGAADLSLDFGFVAPSVSVGNRVWIDTNRDGLQTFGEPGLAGVVLRITTVNGDPVTDVFGNAVTTTTTDANGNYVFANLPVGAYKVTVVDPAGYTPTVAGEGTDRAIDSSTGSATSANLTVNGETDMSLDFGFVLSAVSVGDLVWNDLDGDGIQDIGEPGIAGVELSILTSTGSPVTDVYGKPVTTVVTDLDGRYVFDNLPVGTYRVTVVPPAGFTATAADQGTDPSANSSAGSATSTDLTRNGESDMTLDFGFVATAVSVGDCVWLDIDRDGIQDVGEPGIAGVTLTISNPAGTDVVDVHGTTITTIVTDASGHYAFVDLPPGSYIVTVTPPSDLLPTTKEAGSDPALDSSTGSATSAPLLTNKEWDRTLDFGFVLPEVSVGDLVWLDRDRDGVQDAGEPGIPGVTLSITNADGIAVVDVFGNPVTTTTTDANGHYRFDHLPLGTYIVSVVDPVGYLPTIPGATGGATDSSSRFAQSANLVADGQSDMSLDFGFVVPLVEVAPIIWNDTNANGAVDQGEAGVAGVAVDITNPDGTVVYDGLGEPVAPVLTDGDGRARFAALPTGRYSLRASLPPGWTAISGCPTCDAATGIATSAELQRNGDADLSLGFGLVAPASPVPPVEETTTTTVPPSAPSPCPECIPVERPVDEPCPVCVGPIGALPLTGTDSAVLVVTGLVLLFGGLGLVLVRRRNRS